MAQSRQLHFPLQKGRLSLGQQAGLGDATAIEKFEIWWPTFGQRQTFTDKPID